MSELGIYRAVVVDNADPHKRGRVIVHIPAVLGTARSEWCEPTVPQWVHTPSIGDIVHVGFMDGDLARPVYISTPLVDSTIIKAGGVNNDRLAGGISNDKLAGGITNDKLAGGITADKLAFAAVTAGTSTTLNGGYASVATVGTAPSTVTVYHALGAIPRSLSVIRDDAYLHRFSVIRSALTASTFQLHVTDMNNVNLAAGIATGFYWIAIA